MGSNEKLYKLRCAQQRTTTNLHRKVETDMAWACIKNVRKSNSAKILSAVLEERPAVGRSRHSREDCTRKSLGLCQWRIL